MHAIATACRIVCPLRTQQPTLSTVLFSPPPPPLPPPPPQVEGHTGPGSTPPELWDVCRTGLGLYLVKQTLASMGSDLAASSEVGYGSSFEFDVPLADSDCESESEVDAELFSEPGR